MRKFSVVIFAVFSMLFAFNIDVNAEELRSFSDWVSSYGYAGERILGSFSNGTCIGVVGSEQSVCAIQYNGYVMAFTTDPKENSIFRGATDQFPFNGGYIDRNWITTVNTLNLGNLYSPFTGVDLSSVFSLDSTTVYYRVFGNGSIETNNCDVNFTNIDDFVTEMENNDWQNPNDPSAPDSNNLPMLQFGLVKKTVLGFPQVTQIKEILTWDYTTQPLYSNDPTDFHMEMVASARWTSAPTGIGNIRDTSDNSINDSCKVYITNGGCNVSTNQFSWIYRDIGKSLYAISGEPWDDNSGYFMYVRTVQDSTGKASAWKVYNLALNGTVVQEDIIIEPDGQQKPLPENQKDIGTGQGVQAAKFDTDSSTSADSDPTSVRYDEGSGNFNAGTAISTLKSIVNQIIELPSILTKLLGFMPSWLTSLMVVGMGLAVTIGVVKMILK